MNKTIITFFLMMLSGIPIFAQQHGSEYSPREREDRGFQYESPLERCYKTTDSFEEFARCYEREKLPVCPRSWKEIGGEYFPCRIIDERERKPEWLEEEWRELCQSNHSPID